MISGIYYIMNLINGKLYVGSALDIPKRWISHRYLLNSNKHYSPHLQAAWNKYGKDIFVFEVLEIVKNSKDLIKREQYYLDLFESYKHANGYNICTVAYSRLGVKHTKKSITKQIKKQLGRIVSEETRQKIGKANKGNKSRLGKRHTLATRLKMSRAQKGKKASPKKLAHLKILHAMKKGQKQSKETCQKRSIALMGNQNAKGTVVPKKRRKQISITLKKHWKNKRLGLI